MEITYIGHSGFMVEWETCYWLFDYYKGEIPELNSDKMIYIFASHNHGDHYNPDILTLNKKYPNVKYILSSDIKVKTDLTTETVNSDSKFDIIPVKPSNAYEFYDDKQNVIQLKTLKSTDSGVAFLLKYLEKTIYHAGDLNLWVWKEETKQYNNNMKAMFQKEMHELKDVMIDVAFAPLDPRQEEWYRLGLDQLLDTANIKYVFPMHFWDKPEIIQQYKNECSGLIKQTTIIEINHSGQKWSILNERVKG